MRNESINVFLSFLFYFGILFSNGTLVLAGAIPVRALEEISIERRATGKAVEVSGLEVLKPYVCSPCTNTVKRQASSGTFATIFTIPSGSLVALYSEIEAVIDAVSAAIQAQGLSTRSISALRRRDSTSTIEVPQILTVLTTYVCPSCSNKLRRRTATTSFTISASDLIDLQRQLKHILNQLLQLIQAQGLSLSSDAAAGGANDGLLAQRGSPLEVRSSPPMVMIPIVDGGTTNGGYMFAAATSISAYTIDACDATVTIQSTTTIGAIVDASSPSTTAPSVAAGGTTARGNPPGGGVFLQDGSSSTGPSAAATSRATGNTASIAASSHATGNTATAAVSSPATSSTATVAAAQPSSSSASSGGSTGGNTSGYTFNSQSTKNMVVYYGQTPVTGSFTLESQCADSDIDIVVLAFIIANNYQGGAYPQINFGAACGGQTSEMASQAPGLLYCPELAGNISTCQSTYGKKVMLSIGGATSQVSFTDTSEATDFANVLWKLFGPTGNIDDDLRPFADVVVDGFDIDNENNMPANFDTMASTLRSNFGTTTSKQFYLSSAPQCPFPDASNPTDMLLQLDFIFIQFYNNPPCEIGSTGFDASIQQWSSAMEASTNNPKPRIYLGAPAFSQAGSTAYAAIGSASGMYAVAKTAEAMGLPNFGGIMFWDGPEGMDNVEDGKNIIGWAKAGLDA